MSDRLNSARSTPLQDRRRRIHLLVVDDSISVQRAVKDVFRGLQDYIVSACGDVASAERLLASNPADLLLCDVVLPGPSGYDLCSRIKEERTDLPVLLLTSAFEPFDEERARHVLADGIIAKPFTALKLRQTVEEALQKSGAAARRRAPQGTPASIQPSPADQASGIGAPGATAPPERSGNDLPEIQTADIVGGAQP
ncbi:MAG: response regulator, partial [Acidobacteriota bacterium]